MQQSEQQSGAQQLPEELDAALTARGIAARDEVGLRLALEVHLPGYMLCRLTPAAARRCKCRYRIMFEAAYFDCQTVAEAYARAAGFAARTRVSPAVASRSDPGAGAMCHNAIAPL